MDATDDIRQELRRDRQVLEGTRSAITEKLAILEGRLQETVDQVKHTFDVRYQVGQRPWLMLAGSVLVGYALGHQGGGASRAMVNGVKASAAHTEPPPGDGLASINGAASSALLGGLWAMARQVLRVWRDVVSSKPGIRPSR